MTATPPPSVSASDWIRIFASRLAQRRPQVCAEDVLKLAIDHFKRSHALPPELAAAQLDATENSPAKRPG